MSIELNITLLLDESRNVKIVRIYDKVSFVEYKDRELTTVGDGDPKAGLAAVIQACVAELDQIPVGTGDKPFADRLRQAPSL